MKFIRDKRDIVIALLAILFLIKVPKEGTNYLFWVIAGVFLCLLWDFLINRAFLKKEILLKSAIISGFIVSGILDYRQPWFVLAIICSLAILSKHIFKFNKRHIFNPANFALFVATIFKIPLTWNIGSNITLIIICGLYLAYVYKKFSHILGFLVFFGIPSVLTKTNPFLLISWFFLFIMLIEPKTSGYGLLRGFLFGGISGLISFLIFRLIPIFDPFIASLFFANLANPLLDKLIFTKQPVK